MRLFINNAESNNGPLGVLLEAPLGAYRRLKINKKQQQPNIDIAVHIQLLGKLDFQGISY